MDITTMSLYDASMRGCVTTLNELVQNDPLILDRLSLTSLSETPLHIASLRGHLDFAKALLSLKPKLGTELDSCRRSALHLAAAAGHTEIVKVILGSMIDRSNSCLIRDEDGRIALHLAVMRGRVEAMAELAKACPDSVNVLLEGESVLHLCVRYNHLEALKVLVSKFGNENEFLNSVDMDDNTILHLAVKLNQIETVKYLVSLPGLKSEAKDVLQNSPRPRDFQSLQIQGILMDHANEGQIIRNSTPPPPKGGARQEEHLRPPAWCQWLSTRTYRKIRQYMLTYKSDWVEQAHGNFMVVATVFATMSFSAANNPPGGVWQEDTTEGDNCKDTCEAGTAVLAYRYKREYKLFFISNTISFIASLSVILLHFAGFGLKTRVGMWLLTLAMCTTLTCTLLTYLKASWLVSPDDIFTDVRRISNKVSYLWYTLLACACLAHSVRICYWLCFIKVPKHQRKVKLWWSKWGGTEDCFGRM